MVAPCVGLGIGRGLSACAFSREGFNIAATESVMLELLGAGFLVCEDGILRFLVNGGGVGVHGVGVALKRNKGSAKAGVRFGPGRVEGYGRVSVGEGALGLAVAQTGGAAVGEEDGAGRGGGESGCIVADGFGRVAVEGGVAEALLLRSKRGCCFAVSEYLGGRLGFIAFNLCLLHCVLP